MEQKKIIDIERIVDLLSAIDKETVEEMKESLAGLKENGKVIDGVYFYLLSEICNTCCNLYNVILSENCSNTKFVDSYNDNWLIDILNKFANTTKKEVTTYLYFMHNNTSMLTKIGISKDPINRHRTLSSMENSLKICSAIPCRNRKIASKCERFLHNKYNAKRICGEWYNLTNDELEKATQTGREFIINLFKDGE